jgi:glyoxylase-like metal-dependent hydrolase (beta-lactamase superfamily II)
MTSSGDNPPLLMGTRMPDVDVWSDRVIVALGQNPSAFTGPGTNTYLVGTGAERILLDTGHGVTEYLPFLDQALERAGCRIQEIVLTHGHPDHIGGVEQIMERHGEVRVSKHPWPEIDAVYPFEIRPLGDGDVVETEGATLRGLFTPGHAPDHICFVLEEEGSIFTGDNVLGVGTTVIPAESGDLSLYMSSLDKLLQTQPTRLYPAHGPVIEDGPGKLREYIDHRNDRERQILEVLSNGADEIHAMVKIIYAAYPEYLHAAAGSSVGSHLLKLEAEARVTRDGQADAPPGSVRWQLA